MSLKKKLIIMLNQAFREKNVFKEQGIKKKLLENHIYAKKETQQIVLILLYHLPIPISIFLEVGVALL